MNNFVKKLIRHALFAAVGAVVGLVYYKVAGCQSGGCAITSSLGGSMLYGSFWGFWISWFTSGGCCCGGDSCEINSKEKE